MTRLTSCPRSKSEVVLADDEVIESAAEAVVRAAKTGKIGDGKLFVLDVERGGPDPDGRRRRKSNLVCLTSKGLTLLQHKGSRCLRNWRALRRKARVSFQKTNNWITVFAPP